MENKKTRVPKENPSPSPTLGIPKVLRNIHLEKASEVCPVKLQFSLKKFLKNYAGAKGISGWIRETVIRRLEEEARLE